MSMKVLMVIDAQNDFITGALGNKECEAAVPKIVEMINSKKYDEIILTMDSHDENYMETKEGKNLPVPHCIVPTGVWAPTDGWMIHPDVYAAIKRNYDPDKIEVFKKPTFGAISIIPKYQKLWEAYGPNLEIDFVGFCTGICVLSNVAIAKATLPEANICVIEDACACVTPKTHKTAIEAMKLIQIDMLQTKDL